MINYYEILGLPNSASIHEIKIAFRKLAKVYHPDKGSGNKEKFIKILKAYETLSNPNSKSTYDYNLNFNRNQYQNYTHRQNSSKQASKKEFTFTEKEIQRRKYYDEHIKKYAKKYTDQTQEQIKKSNYNEFKYMLYATPIAVILFVLIAFVATPSEELSKQKTFAKVNQLKIISLEETDVPFAPYFGKLKFDTLNNKIISVSNKTIEDIVICMFNKDLFVRSVVVKSGDEVQILNLPRVKLNWRVCSGKSWSYDYFIKSKSIYGNFTEMVKYYKSISEVDASIQQEFILADFQTQFKQISEEEFFKKD